MNIFTQQNKMTADIGLVLVVLVDTRALAGRVTARSKKNVRICQDRKL